jgi:NAD(P)H dehydrogenase (quinone)
MHISIVYDSNFKGQTEVLAKCIGTGIDSVENVSSHLVHVDQVADNWGTLHSSDGIIFGSPTYVGSISGKFKIFIEELAGEVWLKRLWKNKIAAGFTVSAGRSGDKLNCLNQMVIFASQMAMIWVPQPILGGHYSSQGNENDLNRIGGYLGVMAQANIDESSDVSPPESDRETARLHGRHVALITSQFVAGRAALPIEEESAGESDHQGRPLSLKELFK